MSTPAPNKQRPPWLVGLWRGMGQSIVTSLVGSAIVEFTNGHFELRDIAVPLLVLAQRSLEGLKDTAITP